MDMTSHVSFLSSHIILTLSEKKVLCFANQIDCKLSLDSVIYLQIKKKGLLKLKTLTTYESLQTEINTNEKLLLFVMSDGCTVCHADQPRVQALVEEINLPAVQITVNQMPEAAGQLSLFTSPVVILFKNGKEFHRQARIIDFEKLKRSMEQLKMI